MALRSSRQPFRSVGFAAGLFVAWIVAAGVASTPGSASAQFGGGAGGGGVGGGGVGGGGVGGGGGGFGGSFGGVMIDADGVLRMQSVADAGLSLERRKAAVATLPADLRKRSPLRKVALSRLEAEVAKAAADGRAAPEEIAKLAGLTRVQYVFIYPTEGDAPGEVVLAGPAEPWITDATGRVVGTETGSPTVLLEDLAAAVRAFPPGNFTDRTLGCSIDPKPEGLKAMQEFLRTTGRVNPQGGVDQLVNGLKQSLGTQTVRIDGVHPATHFAQVLVEADYRMKLIGIGLERPPVKMASWIDLASAGSVAKNALQRWYFVPNYECVRITEDDLGVELVGRGVKLCGADEVVLPGGGRMAADRPDKASGAFTDAFTRKYEQIAAANPVYAQLRTLIDLAVAAAYMQEHDAFGRTGWSAEALRDEQTLPIERLPVPTEVETAITAVWRGNRLLTPIGGGVVVQPRQALDASVLMTDEQSRVATARAASARLPEGRWWWD